MENRNAAVELALGRILRMSARPTQAGDIAEYERCRCVILAELDPIEPDYRPNWVRDRQIGAAGD